jgi:hypothetical protein
MCLIVSVTVSGRIRENLRERSRIVESRSVSKPRVVYCRGNSSEKKELAHCEASGFYPHELVKKHSYNWTDGHAILSCSLPRRVALRWLWIELQSGPSKNSVELRFNDQVILKRDFKGRLRLRLRLPRTSLSNHFKIQIDSDVFVPSPTLTDKDDRKLGVLVSEIRVAKYWWRNLGFVQTIWFPKEATINLAR